MSYNDIHYERIHHGKRNAQTDPSEEEKPDREVLPTKPGTRRSR